MFPMSIWIPHDYPRTIPINLVTPTRNMSVRPGQYVSGEGRVYHPYLAGWREEVCAELPFKGLKVQKYPLRSMGFLLKTALNS